MKLLAKFSLIFTIVFGLGLAGAGYVFYDMLQRNAREQVLYQAHLMMDSAMATRSYTTERIKPVLAAHKDGVFRPESVPAFAATEIFEGLRKNYPSYSYKEATLNPTNPRDKAVDWEEDIIRIFRGRAVTDKTPFEGERMTPTGKSVYLASPLRAGKSCLDCHSTPEAAPPEMIKLYGSNNGFGWKQDEVIGAQIVSVPAKLAEDMADRAFRQYDAADPENRLVAGELEARWNRALTRVTTCEARIVDHDAAAPQHAVAPASFGTLADDLQAVWSASTTDARLKKRIVRTLIHEAVADLDDSTAEIVLTLHWVGGAHTEHRLPRRRRGQRTSTPANVVDAVRTLALIARDDVIAGFLNRNGLKTGHGNRWTRERVTALRSSYRIPLFREAPEGAEPWLNLSQAAALIGIAARTLRLAAERGEIEAKHPLEDGPWIFSRATLDSSAVRALVLRATGRPTHPAVPDPAQQSLFSSRT